jgi:hypothetical protein
LPGPPAGQVTISATNLPPPGETHQDPQQQAHDRDEEDRRLRVSLNVDANQRRGYVIPKHLATPFSRSMTIPRPWT